MAVKSYSMLSNTRTVTGSTGTGLDQLIDFLENEPSLGGNVTRTDLVAGGQAADALNRIILEAAAVTGAAADGQFTAAEVVAMNGWIRANRLTQWTALHGDDEGDEETGFHLVQNDGANTNYRGQNLVNTVMDGIYHMGFEIQNGVFQNEDGDANASVEQVAGWLTQFYTDHSKTSTGFDRITNLIMADSGLAAKITQAEIDRGADAANGLNQLIVDAIRETGVANDQQISVDDIRAINSYIRSDASRLERFLALHGDDEGAQETGYHLVQNDGANTGFFGKNLVNTVADGMYHIGFSISGNNILNEDGNANASLTDLAAWYDYFYTDVSTTNTGLDRIVDIIKTDQGLARNTSAQDINAGARIANRLNQLIVDGLNATGSLTDGWVDRSDIVAVNRWIRNDTGRLALFLELHGDDEDGEETGYHLVQNDGGNTNFFGKNLINGPADSLYHIGFGISGSTLVNEDGNANADINDLAAWLNYFLRGTTYFDGTGSADTASGTDGQDEMLGRGGNDTLRGGAGDDHLLGGSGNDTLNGGVGNDMLDGGNDTDTMDGGDGSDSYRISGSRAAGWATFQGYDIYQDTGSSGVDAIVVSDADAEIGIKQMLAGNGIERIDLTAATGATNVIGDSGANTIDLRQVTVVGGSLAAISGDWGADTIYGTAAADTIRGDGDNDVLDGAGGNDTLDGGTGNDTINGGAGADTIIGGHGDDTLDGGDGSDTFRITGSWAEGWSSQQGYDALKDTGATGTDTLQAYGANVDIGMREFSRAGNGIEVIDTRQATGTVRLLGDSKANTIDLRGVTVQGAVTVVGDWGTDTIYGSAVADLIDAGGDADTIDGGAGDDTILAGSGDDTVQGGTGNDLITASNGNDTVNGGDGSDTYMVGGSIAAGWSVFQGYDTYADTGTTGSDSIVAQGADVDIAFFNFQSTGIEVIDATQATGLVRLVGDGKANTLDFRGVTIRGNVTVAGDWGADVIYGSSAAETFRGEGDNDTIKAGGGNDLLIGGLGDDALDGGDGADTYRYTGNRAGGWSSFESYDTITDTGSTGSDKIEAVGADVDIGLRAFGTGHGIEVIDTTQASGITTLVGDANANTLDFRATTLIGTRIVIDGGWGADTIYGSAIAETLFGAGDKDALYGGGGDDTLLSGLGDDTVDGGAGSDVYRVSGNRAGGWSSFEGYDSYRDSGTSGIDKIVAVGANVDIGVQNFGPQTGIEMIDLSGASGTTTLVSTSAADTLDLRGVQVSGMLAIDSGSGADTVYGSAAAETILSGGEADVVDGGAGDDILQGGLGDDSLAGGAGNDSFRYTGNQAGGWASFEGYDTFSDIAGTDTLLAVGTDVDIGLKGSFGAANGIERLDASGATGITRLLGDSSANTLDFSALTVVGAQVWFDGGDGDDTLIGNGAANILQGGRGNDTLKGGQGDDVYRYTGNAAGGWSSFQSYDTIIDGGTSTGDKIIAVGADVDIGLAGTFSAALSGIETVDASAATGKTRLLGDSTSSTLDFSGITLSAGSFVLDGGDGHDTVIGNAADNTLQGGRGDDTLKGGAGSDTYVYTGNAAGGWSSFQGYDTIIDGGATGTDKIVVIGADVDIGVENLNGSGIEAIDLTQATGNVRIVGSGNANTIDLRGISVSKGFSFDLSWGNDTVYATSFADTLLGGGGDDTFDAGAGNDTLDGGSGADNLTGGAGDDTYLFNRGSGNDKLTDSDATAGNRDVLQFGSDIAAAQLWLRKVGTDLEVRVIGGGDKVTIVNWYGGAANHVEAFKLNDGKQLLDSKVDALVQAMAAFSPPGWGQTTLNTAQQSALGTLIASSWTAS